MMDFWYPIRIIQVFFLKQKLLKILEIHFLILQSMANTLVCEKRCRTLSEWALWASKDETVKIRDFWYPMVSKSFKYAFEVKIISLNLFYSFLHDLNYIEKRIRGCENHFPRIWWVWYPMEETQLSILVSDGGNSTILFSKHILLAWT